MKKNLNNLYYKKIKKNRLKIQNNISYTFLMLHLKFRSA